MVPVAYGQGGGDIEGQDEGWHPPTFSFHISLPPAFFKNVFDVYNFSITSNLFDSNKPYRTS